MLGWGSGQSLPVSKPSISQEAVGTPLRVLPSEGSGSEHRSWATWPGQEGLESRGCGSRAWQAAVWLLKRQPMCSSGRELLPTPGGGISEHDPPAPTGHILPSYPPAL